MNRRAFRCSAGLISHLSPPKEGAWERKKQRAPEGLFWPPMQSKFKYCNCSVYFYSGFSVHLLCSCGIWCHMRKLISSVPKLVSLFHIHLHWSRRQSCKRQNKMRRATKKRENTPVSSCLSTTLLTTFCPFLSSPSSHKSSEMQLKEEKLTLSQKKNNLNHCTRF